MELGKLFSIVIEASKCCGEVHSSFNRGEQTGKSESSLFMCLKIGTGIVVMGAFLSFVGGFDILIAGWSEPENRDTKDHNYIISMSVHRPIMET